ncbi:MAG: hypothetical protein ACMUJM_12870 [bacterium]
MMKIKKGKIALFSFVVVVIFSCIFNIVNFDFGWHLKTGEYITQNFSIPRHDIFSYIAEGNKWIDSHWLFQVILYSAYAIGGAYGCIVLRCCIVLGTFLLLYFIYYKDDFYAVSIIVGLIALFCGFQRFLLRPEIFTFLFIVIFFYFIENFSKYKYAVFFILPFIQLLWSNMHGLYILGIIFMMLYYCGECINILIYRYLGKLEERECSMRIWTRKLICLLLVSGASLINANGKDGILYPFTIFQEIFSKATSPIATVGELISPFSFPQTKFPDPVVMFKILIVLSLVAFLMNIKKIRFCYLLPFCAFLFLAVLSFRNIAIFALIATPMTVYNIAGFIDSLKGKTSTRLVKLRHATSMALFISIVIINVVIIFLISNNYIYKRLGYHRKFGFGISEYFPQEAVDYIKANADQIGGNLFNSADIGGYLIWQLYPEWKVSLDGRWEVYGNFIHDIRKLADRSYFMQLVHRYNIMLLVLGKTSQEYLLLRWWLGRDPGWRFIKQTQNTIIFKRRYF